MINERRLQIALVSIHYPPLRTSAAVQMSHLAEELVSLGHKIVVITPRERMQSCWSLEMLGGVDVLQLAGLKISLTSHFRRTLFELSLPFLMIVGLRRSPYKNTKWDLVVWYSPTIFFGLLVFYMKLKSSCKSYLILRDIFPDWAHDLGIIRKGFVYYFFKFVANFQYAIADSIGVQSDSNLHYLNKWKDDDGKKLEVLENWQTPSKSLGSCSINILNTTLLDRKIFVYIGNMGLAQSMDIMIDLAASLTGRVDLGFVFVGRGTEVDRLKSKVKSLSMSNTLFFDEIDANQVPELLKQCHIGLIALDPRHKSHNIPGKLLTYLSAGLPVLARVNKSTDLVDLIEREGIGLAYTGKSIDVFKTMAEDMVDNSPQYKLMASKGPKLIKERFSTGRAACQILKTVG